MNGSAATGGQASEWVESPNEASWKERREISGLLYRFREIT